MSSPVGEATSYAGTKQGAQSLREKHPAHGVNSMPRYSSNVGPMIAVAMPNEQKEPQEHIASSLFSFDRRFKNTGDLSPEKVIQHFIAILVNNCLTFCDCFAKICFSCVMSGHHAQSTLSTPCVAGINTESIVD